MSKEWRKIYDDAVARIQKKDAIRKSKNIYRESWESITIRRADPVAQETLVNISNMLSVDFQGFKFILDGFGYDRYDYSCHRVSGVIEIWTDEEFNSTPQDI